MNIPLRDVKNYIYDHLGDLPNPEHLKHIREVLKTAKEEWERDPSYWIFHLWYFEYIDREDFNKAMKYLHDRGEIRIYEEERSFGSYKFGQMRIKL